jgi:hypothetical protein
VREAHPWESEKLNVTLTVVSKSPMGSSRSERNAIESMIIQFWGGGDAAGFPELWTLKSKPPNGLR